MESGVEEKSGGGSVENSKKRRSLDLQTLYKSGDLKKESDIDVRKKKKKRRSIKAVSSDKPEAEKKSRSSVDEDHVNGDSAGPVESRLSSSSSGLEKRLNYGNGLSGFSLSLDSNVNAIPIPKRPRGTVARKKFDSGRALLLSRVQTSVIGNGRVKSEPDQIEGDQLPKRKALSGGEGEAKSDEQSSKLPSHSAGNGVAVKVKRQISIDESREKKKDKASSIPQAKDDGHVSVNNGETSSKKHRSARNKRKNSSRIRKSVKNGVPSGDNMGSFRQESLDDDDEDNTGLF